MFESLPPSFERLNPEDRADCMLNNYEQFLSVLSEARLSPLGEARDIVPESTGPYSNSVVLTEISTGELSDKLSGGSNSIRIFACDLGNGDKLHGIFKPEGGENKQRKEVFQIATPLLVREVAASVIDQAMRLGLVPPTTERSIGSERGSLQLYVPSEVAVLPHSSPGWREIYKPDCRDWKKMAMLDILINNADRNEHNYLVYKHDPSRLVAIDHGYSFCMARPNDPTYAIREFSRNPDACGLDNELCGNLENLLQAEGQVMNSLPEEIADIIDLPSYNIFDKSRRMLDAKRLLFDWGQK